MAARSFGNPTLKPAIRLEALQIMVNCTAVEYLARPETILQEWHNCVTFLFDDLKFQAIIFENLDNSIKPDASSFNLLQSLMIYIQVYALQLGSINSHLQNCDALKKLLHAMHNPPQLSPKYWGCIPKVAIELNDSTGCNAMPDITITLLEETHRSIEPMKNSSDESMNNSSNESNALAILPAVKRTNLTTEDQDQASLKRSTSFTVLPPENTPKHDSRCHKLRVAVLRRKSMLALGIATTVILCVVIVATVVLLKQRSSVESAAKAMCSGRESKPLWKTEHVTCRFPCQNSMFRQCNSAA